MKAKTIAILSFVIICILAAIFYATFRLKSESNCRCDGSCQHINQLNISTELFTLYNGYLSFNNAPFSLPPDGFAFDNGHIVLENYDMTQSPLYKEGRIDDLMVRIELSRERSNATVEDLERAMEQYEFYVFKVDEDHVLYMKSFNGISTNDWYRRTRGHFMKSIENITAEMMWEFLQDPLNDPRNFSGEIPLPNLRGAEIYGIDIEPMVVLKEGQLYPKIFVQIAWYTPSGRIAGEAFSINASTGIVYDSDEFSRAPTFP